MEKIPVLAVVGPTASGKTSLAIEIAKEYHGEVVSADSMQLYKEMQIATAKPTVDEMQGIPHHLLDFLAPDVSFSVAQYAALAHQTISEITARGHLPVMAGGTGLYVDAVLDDLIFAKIETDEQKRAELWAFVEAHGANALHERLREIDPESAARIHENNVGRIVRAVEVYELTGITMSEHQRNSRPKESRYRSLKIGINYKDRAVLYDRVNRRVDLMMEQGLLEEAVSVRNRARKTAVQAIGYKELEPYFLQQEPLDVCIERLKQETRRYAKRQITWFSRDPNILWVYPDEQTPQEIFSKIKRAVENFIKV
ncbi:tRNA (adenosine(37)-N6)-dimethylallyltransferase MiaA [Phocea massiliensis]|uniref:tRNA dimethylallyltransferase n=1 Tax=Merdimmobilis hominis TaxID=2897707 RepID=A0A938X8A1_9FIRM|nr:tRNA (adenosine(37)-N6)-dimethylallyltransferase MiaA [Merdimmobilis hominis]MBM6921344.1 tRNA (adenosine(37)-N6)-dimethylallyltransferase MiaA [Merdimmobilis hominis]